MWNRDFVEYPNDLWSIIKDYMLDWKKTHAKKHKLNLPTIEGVYGPMYGPLTLQSFPPRKWVEFTQLNFTGPTYWGPRIPGNYGIGHWVPQTIIEHYQEKCSEFARKWQPHTVSAYYGWTRLKLWSCIKS